MTKTLSVEVVNRQEIGGEVRERGEVIELPRGRARDLIRAGKVREVPKPAPKTDEVAPKAEPAADKPAPKTGEKGGK